MSTRRDSSFLKDILHACRRIEAIVAATLPGAFLEEEIIQAAVLHHLTVIGEAVSRLSIELRAKHPEVAWHQVVAVRNRIVHAYFELDWQILRIAASENVPVFKRQIAAILESEFPE